MVQKLQKTLDDKIGTQKRLSNAILYEIYLTIHFILTQLLITI